jgi:thioredoxin 1
MATTFSGKLQIAKMNVDENRRIADQFSIRGIPTLMMFKEGKLVATKVGALTKSQMADFIKDNLEAQQA